MYGVPGVTENGEWFLEFVVRGSGWYGWWMTSDFKRGCVTSTPWKAGIKKGYQTVLIVKFHVKRFTWCACKAGHSCKNI